MKTGLKNKIAQKNGFTLVELSMVILIFGTVSGILFLALKYYTRAEVKTETEDALSTAEAAIYEFQIKYGRYPCPADPSLGPNDANYGYEGQPCDGLVPYLNNVEGERDTLFDDAVDDPGNLPDRVLIGSVPFNTLLQGPDRDPQTEDDQITFVEMTDKFSTDGWGRKLTYAVTLSQTNSGTYNDFNGVIDIIDENGLSVLGTPDTAHFVLISHGENGRGARMADGALVDACPPTLPIPVPVPPLAPAATEITNCNNDGTFLSGLKNDSDSFYNDDMIRIVSNQSGNLWAYTGLNRVNNTNSGFVGIGKDDPTYQLDLAGGLGANNLLASDFCDAGGANCIRGNLLDPNADQDTGTAGNQNMRCPAGQVVTEIRNNRVVCTNAFAASGALACAPGLYMIGISNTRGALCCNPLLPSTNPASCLNYVP